MPGIDKLAGCGIAWDERGARVPTRITAAKLDQAVKALRAVLDCQDVADHLDTYPVEDLVRRLLQARMQFWNKPRRFPT